PFAYSNDRTKIAREWLFDIRKDPLEQNNLVVKYAGVTDQMRSVANDILAENKAVREKISPKPTLFVKLKDNKLVSQLRSLGYLQ
ncbi:MAG: hypothetical protein ABH891_10205, partial [Candidatus Omnitrophota bacterium]